MTRREVLTNIVCAYIQGCGKFPSLDSKGSFNETWYKTVEAICNKYPEEDKQEIRMMSTADYEGWLNLKSGDASVSKISSCENLCCDSVNRRYDY